MAWLNSSLPYSAVCSKNNNYRGIRGSERNSVKKVCSFGIILISLQDRDDLSKGT